MNLQVNESIGKRKIKNGIRIMSKTEIVISFQNKIIKKHKQTKTKITNKTGQNLRYFKKVLYMNKWMMVDFIN